MGRVASPATQEAGVVPELCRASWLLPFSRKLKTETRLKPPATPALVPYHVHGGIALVTLVRSLATSCYFDFIDLKKKKVMSERLGKLLRVTQQATELT